MRYPLDKGRTGDLTTNDCESLGKAWMDTSVPLSFAIRRGFQHNIFTYNTSKRKNHGIT